LAQSGHRTAVVERRWIGECVHADWSRFYRESTKSRAITKRAMGQLLL
jgi:hypothetical protein